MNSCEKLKIHAFWAFKWIFILSVSVFAVIILIIAGFLMHVDLTVFSKIRHNIDIVNDDPKRITPSREFVRVFCNAKKRNPYWDVVRFELPDALGTHTMGRWHLYGVSSHMLAHMYFSDKDIAKFIANSYTDQHGISLQNYSLDKFHHGISDVTCEESAELESITYFHITARQTIRMQEVKQQLCTAKYNEKK